MSPEVWNSYFKIWEWVVTFLSFSGGRYIDIKKEIAEAMTQMHEKICKKFERLNKACINEIRHQFHDLKEAVVPAESLRAVGETLTKCKATLDVSFPIEDTAEFLRLEAALAEKEETQQALVIIQIFICSIYFPPTEKTHFCFIMQNQKSFWVRTDFRNRE